MSNVTHGMNLEEVRRLGEDLQRISETLTELANRMDRSVDCASWIGSDARRYKSDWWPKHRKTLLVVAQDLHGFGQSAKNNADEQERISGVGGGGGFGTSSAVAGGVSWGSLVDGAKMLDENLIGPIGLVASELSHLGGAGMPNWILHNSKAFGSVGDGIGWISRGVTLASVVDAVADGRYADAGIDVGIAGGEAIASNLKTKGALGYLGGVTAQVWSEVGKAAKEIDWSPEGIKAIKDASIKEWIPAIGEGLTKLPGPLSRVFGF